MSMTSLSEIEMSAGVFYYRVSARHKVGSLVSALVSWCCLCHGCSLLLAMLQHVSVSPAFHTPYSSFVSVRNKLAKSHWDMYFYPPPTCLQWPMDLVGKVTQLLFKGATHSWGYCLTTFLCIRRYILQVYTIYSPRGKTLVFPTCIHASWTILAELSILKIMHRTHVCRKWFSWVHAPDKWQ